jgi:hypothetical protein
MAITAAQASADRRSLATQNARSTTRIANVVRVTNRARASMGSTFFSGGRSSILALLGVDPEWHGIVGSLYGAREAPDLCNAITSSRSTLHLDDEMAFACGRAASIDGCQCAGVCMLF